MATALAAARTDPRVFLAQLHETFAEAACAVGGPLDRFYHVGNLGLRLRFAGDALVPKMARALAHLETMPHDDPALTISLWDSESTRTSMPPPPWDTGAYVEQGKIQGFFDDRVAAQLQWGSHALTLLDRARNQGFYWVKRAAQVPDFETAMPLRTLLALGFAARGLPLVHAAAVGLPEGGVLLAGKGGTGKSTVALACLEAGLCYAADDFCLLSPEPPTALSLYCSARVNADLLERLPRLNDMVSNPHRAPEDKALVFLHDRMPAKLCRVLPLRAVLAVRLTALPETTIGPTSPGAALAALAPSTLLLVPDGQAELLPQLSRLVRELPCYVLNAGRDLTRIPGAILELLRKI